jgi:hypothetical protein
MEDAQNQLPQEQSAPSVSFPNVNEQKKSNGGKTFLIVGILILVAILGFVIYKSASKAVNDAPSEATPIDDLTTPSSEQTVPVITPEPSASTASIVDKAKVKVQVLNGTGITGEAGYLQTQLEKLGYTNIKTGNNDSTVTNTIVTFSKSLDSGVTSEITQKLNTLYEKVTTSTSSSSTFDVSIVIGLRKGSTPKPTSSATASPSATLSQ